MELAKALSRFEIRLVATIAVIFCIFAVATAHTGMPQPDESLYANPGYNIVYNGHPGTTVVEVAGYISPTLRKHTYWPFPFCLVMMAAWFGVFGFGIMKLRALSVIFGLVGVLSWYVIARRLSGSVVAALAAMSLVSLDYFYVLQASNGRTDMLCAGLGTAALAVYLELRRRSLTQACFWSHLLITLSIATHADGLLYWLGLVFLIVLFDHRRLSVRAVAFAALPALAGMAAWGAYILQDSAGFMAQLQDNFRILHESFGGADLSHSPLIRPLELEWRYRYAGPFGLGPHIPAANRVKAIILAAYLAGVAGGLLIGRVRTQKGPAALSVLTLIAVFYLALVSPSKYYYYLGHVTGFMAAGLGVFLVAFSRLSKWHTRIAVCAFVLVAGLQAAGDIYRILPDPYHREYLPIVEVIEAHTTPKSIIMGSGELWFGLEHDRYIIADNNLGAFSGKTPDLFVMDKVYRDLHESSRESKPQVYAHVQKLLDTYHSIYKDSTYEVFVR